MLMRLEREASSAGGRVHVLFGNHEAMNLLHEFPDVSPQTFKAFADARSEDRRRRAYKEYVQIRGKYGTVVAVPLVSRGDHRRLGVVALDGPPDVQHAVLASPETEQSVGSAAELISIILG